MYRRRRSSGGGSVLDYDPLEEERRRESVSQGAEGDAPDPYAKRIHEVKGKYVFLCMLFLCSLYSSNIVIFRV